MHVHIDCTLLHALAGAHPPDLVIFLGLAVYAVAGCKAQDLRVESSNQVGGTLLGCLRATHYVLEAASELAPTYRSSPQHHA